MTSTEAGGIDALIAGSGYPQIMRDAVTLRHSTLPGTGLINRHKKTPALISVPGFRILMPGSDPACER